MALVDDRDWLSAERTEQIAVHFGLPVVGSKVCSSNGKRSMRSANSAAW
ncbi:hypothetical protein [Saccharopolyspora rosea]|uniref:Uncharacterized protein n=1 Tax=Saccharopolyspora rosea TaxID=524884 RepID=A0ABW3FQP9_9PSEU|nr:hypothetical protein [Saccharopolyspora rosea]